MANNRQGIDAAQVVNIGLTGLALFAGWKVYRVLVPDPSEGQTGGGNLDEPNIGEDVPVPGISAPTLSRQAARAKANAIYAAVYGSGTFWGGGIGEDETAVQYALTQQVETDGDVLLIADEYGIRSGPIWAAGPLDLAGTITTYLNAAERSVVNMYYARHGINIAF